MMKKNWLIRILALTAALLMLSVCAVAEETLAELPAGHVPERGISFPFTQEDTDSGLSTGYYMGATEKFPTLPLLYITYTDLDALNAVLEKYSDADLEDDEVFYAVLTEAFSHQHTLYEIALLDTQTLNEELAAGATLASLLGADNFTVLAENDGYTYVVSDVAAAETYDSAEVQEQVLAMAARAKELLESATYMPVVFAAGEVTSTPDAFPAFETVDLNGNTVTNEIFYGKDLTVVNIWGTYCNPCIDEMPELAEWSKSMPENMQLIGLVSDLYSADDADTLELAQAICEATGADVYTSLVANEDFMDLLYGIVGVPTTLFVDSTGAIVGDPIVGANVAGCKATAEALLSGM